MSAVELFATDEGPRDAPVVVMGSSLGTTGAMWDAQAAALTASRRVVRYDHLGHGHSPEPPGPYTIEEMGAHVVSLLDRLEIERCDYVGLSMGGMVGMWLAAAAPHRVARMVLCCTTAHFGPEMEASWLDRATAVRDAGSIEPIADAVIGRWITPQFAETHPDRARSLRAMLVASPAEGYASCCDALRVMDLRPGLPRIAARTLVIAGAQDVATPPPHGRAIVDAIAGSRLEILDPCGHVAAVERADDVTRLIANHLEEPTA